MKLSKDTIALLKNFASINPNLVITPGNTIKTITEAKSILASATIAESFTQTLGIYDLNEFVSALSLVEDPDVTVEEATVVISGSNTTVRYRLADPEILTKPTKNVTMPPADVKVTLTADVLNKVRKGASVLGHVSVSLRSENGSIALAVVDPKNTAANSYIVDLGVKTDAKFNFDFLLTNLRFVDGDYVLEVSSRLISKWSATSSDLSYLVALEKTSAYSA
jgi:hypothetical protein